MERKSEILQEFILELLMGRRFGTGFFSGRLAFSNRTEGTKGMAFAGVHGWGLALPSSSRISLIYRLGGGGNRGSSSQNDTMIAIAWYLVRKQDTHGFTSFVSSC